MFLSATGATASVDRFFRLAWYELAGKGDKCNAFNTALGFILEAAKCSVLDEASSGFFLRASLGEQFFAQDLSPGIPPGKRQSTLEALEKLWESVKPLHENRGIVTRSLPESLVRILLVLLIHDEPEAFGNEGVDFARFEEYVSRHVSESCDGHVHQKVANLPEELRIACARLPWRRGDPRASGKVTVVDAEGNELFSVSERNGKTCARHKMVPVSTANLRAEEATRTAVSTGHHVGLRHETGAHELEFDILVHERAPLEQDNWLTTLFLDSGRLSPRAHIDRCMVAYLATFPLWKLDVEHFRSRVFQTASGFADEALIAQALDALLETSSYLVTLSGGVQRGTWISDSERPSLPRWRRPCPALNERLADIMHPAVSFVFGKTIWLCSDVRSYDLAHQPLGSRRSVATPPRPAALYGADLRLLPLPQISRLSVEALPEAAARVQVLAPEEERDESGLTPRTDGLNVSARARGAGIGATQHDQAANVSRPADLSYHQAIGCP